MSPSLAYAKKSTIGRANMFQHVTGALSTVAPGVAAMAAEQLFVTVFRHRRPTREEAWADGAVRLSIPSPQGDLATWSWGTGSKTILLVHGWAGRGLQLGAFVEPLVESGYRVVAYDGPAHGESTGRRTNIFKLTEGLVAVADSVGPVSGVIAHSLGTTAVLLAAACHAFDPGRFVAISPMGQTRTMTDWYGEMTGFGAGVVERMRSRLEERIGFRWNDIEPKRLAMSLDAEALVIHDHDDPELPASEGVALARAMPVAEFFLTEGLGHRRILRDPAVVATATDFIYRRNVSAELVRNSHPDAVSAA